MPEPRRESRFHPSVQLPRGPRLVIAALHAALAGALVYLGVRIIDVMRGAGIPFAKIFYVPIGAVALAGFILFRGYRWLRRGDGAG